MKVVMQCPAKVNLFLAVGPKDVRGYHPLRTIFQAVSLFDVLTIERSNRNEFICRWPDMPENNTVTKAMRMLSEIAAMPPLKVTLEKHIPDQSGLGGGSSDAAGFLRCVMKFLPARPSDSDLRDIALAVGADVPFFLVGGRARAEGYGEILTPMDDEPEQWMLIVRPPVDCPTGPAYSKLDKIDYEWRSWNDSDGLYNDFERVMPEECLQTKLELLRLGASQALLTGSGSAVLGLFGSEDEAIRAQTALQKCTNQKRCWIVRSITRHESLSLA